MRAFLYDAKIYKNDMILHIFRFELLGVLVRLREMRIPLERNSQSAIAVRLSAPNGKFLH